MLDVYMVLILAATFGLFSAFLFWCERVIQDSGGEQK